jgi:mitochondrial fission protein ELM1
VISSCWAISDGAAGNERQAVALAQALTPQFDNLHIRFAQPWAAFAPHLLIGASHALSFTNSEKYGDDWPDVAVGCGRQAALLTRSLRRLSRGKTYCVQILDPRINPAAFDLVVAPAHDRLAGDNVIVTTGSLNPIDEDWLQSARVRFPALAMLPSPRTAVLIGASTRAQRLDADYFRALKAQMASLFMRDGGSFLISTSRRSARELTDQLRRDFAEWPGVFWGNEADGPNPYAGFLAWADRIVVTPDSVNMLSEACATGVAVHTFAPNPLDGKIALFHERLSQRGFLSPLGAALDAPKRTPLRETAEVAARIRAAHRSRYIPR